jgi:hypothetical protein
MGLVVTGISQDGALEPVEAALTAAGLALDAIQLIAPDDAEIGAVRTVIGNSVLGDGDGGTGTGVPGLTGATHSSLISRQLFRSESHADRLGDLEIPDDEVQNYIDALQAGRSVIAYFAKPDTLEKAAAAFRASGLARVKVF